MLFSLLGTAPQTTTSLPITGITPRHSSAQPGAVVPIWGPVLQERKNSVLARVLESERLAVHILAARPVGGDDLGPATSLL